jgi:DNA-binding MarR family transcriptional regulator
MPRGLDAPDVTLLPCACGNLRRAARAVTQLYDAELRRGGLRAPQFTLLASLATKGRIRQGRLGSHLALDATTLSRTLRSLASRGWIRSVPATDRRERHWELTPAGRRQFDRARILWDRAQARLRAALGQADWDALQTTLKRVTEAAFRS